jgi:inositol-phosphate transport system permease protein
MASAASSAPAMVRSRSQAARARLTAYGFLAPAGFLVLVFFFIPMLLILFLSITNLATTNFTTDVWRMATSRDPKYIVGLDNFERMFADEFAPKILFNTFFYVLATLLLFNVGLGLVIALLTAHVDRRAGFIFRALWILPRITSPAVYILMWKRIVAASPFGILNQFNELLGRPEANYFQDEAWVFIIMLNGFIGASFGMIIFTSAIESIPKDLMNASLVDGSTTMQRIRYVILPLLRWPLLFVTTYQTLSLLTSFEYILLFNNGGPASQTEVWSLAAYNRALNTYFANAQWGYGSAFAVVLVIIGVVMATVYMRVFRFNELVAEPKIEVL